MSITEEQAQQLLPAYRALRAAESRLASDTAAALAALRAAQLALADRVGSQLALDSTLGGTAAGFLRLFHSAGALAAAPAAALTAQLEFSAAAATVLSTPQRVRLLAAFPSLYPDVAAVVRGALQAHGQLLAEPGSPSGGVSVV